jgi:hypothetical protein
MNSSMRNRFVAGSAVAAALAIALPLLPAVATTNSTELTAQLNGANEVPPADPNGVGEAFVFAAESSPGKLCFVLFVDRIARPIAAHIHRGEAGVVGPVVVPFSTPADGDSAGCVEVSETRVANILANPQRFYVNVHNNTFPNGAIRGQLG